MAIPKINTKISNVNSQQIFLSIDLPQSVPLMTDTVIKKIDSLDIQEIIRLSLIKKLEFLGKGNFGFVYNNGDGTVTKFSHILRKINEYILKNNAENTIEPSDLMIGNFMNEFDNEPNQIIQFGKLKTSFPHNIINIFEVRRAFIEDDIFPVNISKMEYVDGFNVGIFMDNLIKTDNLKELLCFIKKCLILLAKINLLGYFHNDLNLKNIMVAKTNYGCLPVLIDYSFSKKVDKINLFPIECSIWISQIKQYFEYYTCINNDKIKNFLLLVDFFNVLNVKYNIYDTVFVERFIAGSGIFSCEDYLSLQIISEQDINKIFDTINHFNE